MQKFFEFMRTLAKIYLSVLAIFSVMFVALWVLFVGVP